MKVALVTGITGQDGSYLTEFLISKGYQVHGLIRRSSSFNTERINHLYHDPHDPGGSLRLHYGDLSDGNCLREVIGKVHPDEVYNLGAQSHVRVSFDMPIYTADVVALGTMRLLEAIREYQRNVGRSVRFYQASSSEMFGNAEECPQKETTPFNPRSPYAAAKAFAYWITVNYREAYGIHASNGILFNHESPRRGETFVTRKITRAAGRIKHGLQKHVHLGNLDSRRDWGFAGDYVEAMWLMMQRDHPDDYVISTGEAHSVREFLEMAFAYAGLDWRDFVKIDPRYFRPTEVNILLGDSAKARTRLGWQPKVGIQELVKLMMESDLEQAAREKTLRDAGHVLPLTFGHDQ